MTTADESHRSIESARQFLTDLMCPATTPRVPLAVRARARRVLRHFPWGDECLIRAAQVAADRRGTAPGAEQAVTTPHQGVALDVENELG